MSVNTLDKKIKQTICEHLGLEESKVSDQARLAEDLDADSLDALDLLMGVNEEFGIQIPVDKLLEIHTVQEMLQAVKEAINKKKGEAAAK